MDFGPPMELGPPRHSFNGLSDHASETGHEPTIHNSC
jgi:hypothetical protein